GNAAEAGADLREAFFTVRRLPTVAPARPCQRRARGCGGELASLGRREPGRWIVLARARAVPSRPTPPANPDVGQTPIRKVLCRHSVHGVRNYYTHFPRGSPRRRAIRSEKRSKKSARDQLFIVPHHGLDLKLKDRRG